MLEYAVVRFIVASLLIAWYEMVDLVSRLASRKGGPPVLRAPRWTHFVGFASVTYFYIVLGREGGALFGGIANALGFALAMFAMGLRFFARRGTARLRYPHMTARILFFFAVPLVIGAPRAWLVFTLPQLILAVAYARRADAALIATQDPATRDQLAGSDRLVPGVW